MVDAVEQVLRLQPVPGAHGHHVQHVAEVGGGAGVGKAFLFEAFHDKAGIQVIPQPGGERDVPARPEILHVHAEEWLVKVFRHLDAQQVSGADGHAAVAGKVKEKVEGVAIHIGEGGPKAAFRQGGKPVLLDKAADCHSAHAAGSQLPDFLKKRCIECILKYLKTGN